MFGLGNSCPYNFFSPKRWNVHLRRLGYVFPSSFNSPLTNFSKIGGILGNSLLRKVDRLSFLRCKLYDSNSLPKKGILRWNVVHLIRDGQRERINEWFFTGYGEKQRMNDPVIEESQGYMWPCVQLPISQKVQNSQFRDKLWFALKCCCITRALKDNAKQTYNLVSAEQCRIFSNSVRCRNV